MALRGLGSPETSRQGNYFGIVGMTIAVATTLLDPSIDMSNPSIVQLVVAGIVIGGVIGSIIARRIHDSDASAAFHSLVGLAAVLWLGLLIWHRKVGIAPDGYIKTASLVECLLGLRLVRSHFRFHHRLCQA